MFVGGLGLVLTDLFVGHNAIAAPYSWSMTQNCIYYALTRVTYSGGMMLIAFSMFTGGFQVAKELMRRPLLVKMGSMSLILALLTPLVISMFNNEVKSGMFVSFNYVIMLALGNTICVLYYSAYLYLLIHYPMTKLTSNFLGKYLSTDGPVKQKWAAEKLDAETPAKLNIIA